MEWPQAANSGRFVTALSYLLDAGTGAVHDSYDVGDDGARTHLKNALQADATAVGPSTSGYVEEVYFGDTGGSLWRFGLSTSGGNASLMPVHKHDAGVAHPLYASLSTVSIGGTTQDVFMATGIDTLPGVSKLENFSMIGLRDDLASGQPATVRFDHELNRAAATGGDERPTSESAVAGDVVFFTTNTEFPLDPCRCHESALYAVASDGIEAYPTGGTLGAGGNTSIQEIGSWEGRTSSPFVADEHLFMGVDDELRVFGDPDDFNNGASAGVVRITSWREIR